MMLSSFYKNDLGRLPYFLLVIIRLQIENQLPMLKEVPRNVIIPVWWWWCDGQINQDVNCGIITFTLQQVVEHTLFNFIAICAEVFVHYESKYK